MIWGLYKGQGMDTFYSLLTFLIKIGFTIGAIRYEDLDEGEEQKRDLEVNIVSVLFFGKFMIFFDQTSMWNQQNCFQNLARIFLDRATRRHLWERTWILNLWQTLPLRPTCVVWDSANQGRNGRKARILHSNFKTLRFWKNSVFFVRFGRCHSILNKILNSHQLSKRGCGLFLASTGI